NLLDVILKALERREVPRIDHHAVADDPDAVVAVDFAIQHHTARNRTNLADFEGFADFHIGNDFLFEFGFQHALHGGLDLFDGIVYTRIQPDSDLLLFGELAGTR